MKGKVLWITGAAIVLALSLASVAFAATQGGSPATPAPQARGALLADPAAAADLQALRSEHQADMQAWFDKYGADARTSAAQDALTELRAEHHSDMQALLTKYGIDAGLCTGAGMMRGQGAGMMGGGGNGGGMMRGQGGSMGGNGCGVVQSN